MIYINFTFVASHYNKVFKKVLEENQCEILIIGYSFHDEHINNVLKISIEKKNSKIHIVTKESYDELKKKVSLNALKNTYVDFILTA